MVSSEVTRITPSVSWLASALVQLAGRALPCRTAETLVPIVCEEHQSSTPRKISTAHGLSSPLKMRSISPARRPRRRPGRWYLRSPSRRSTRARVPGATSGRPLTTLDTVGSETPASAAMAARVGRRPRLTRGVCPVFVGSVVDTFLPPLMTRRPVPEPLAWARDAQRLLHAVARRSGLSAFQYLSKTIDLSIKLPLKVQRAVWLPSPRHCRAS